MYLGAMHGVCIVRAVQGTGINEWSWNEAKAERKATGYIYVNIRFDINDK